MSDPKAPPHRMRFSYESRCRAASLILNDEPVPVAVPRMSTAGQAAVLILGAVANISHYLDGHSTSENPATALVQTGVAPSKVTPSSIEEGANPEPLATIDILPPPGPGTLFDPVFNSHTVAPGDVLYSIAARCSTTTQVLIELNAIEDPNRIEVGQVIASPEPAPES
jgi:LysM repeat protein